MAGLSLSWLRVAEARVELVRRAGGSLLGSRVVGCLPVCSMLRGWHDPGQWESGSGRCLGLRLPQ